MNAVNSEIAKIYERWLQAVCAQGVFNDACEFSNPYFLGLSDDWDKKIVEQKRILFVGREGFGGHWNKVDMEGEPHVDFCDVAKLQETSAKSMQQRICRKTPEPLVLDGVPYSMDRLGNRGQFSQSMRCIATDCERRECCAVGWTNIDLICHNTKTNGRRVLTDDERKQLHKNPAVLFDVISLAKPTHVVLFSYHNVSLDHEFGALGWDSSKMNVLFETHGKNKIMLKHIGEIPCLITYYHPGYYVGLKQRNAAFCDFIYGDGADVLDGDSE